MQDGCRSEEEMQPSAVKDQRWEKWGISRRKNKNQMLCCALMCSSKINKGGCEPVDPIAVGLGEPVAPLQ